MLIYECIECHSKFNSRLDFQEHAGKTGHKAVEVYDASKLQGNEKGV